MIEPQLHQKCHLLPCVALNYFFSLMFWGSSRFFNMRKKVVLGVTAFLRHCKAESFKGHFACLPCAASCRYVSCHEQSFGQRLIHAQLRTHFGVAIAAAYFVTRIAISTHAKSLMH